MKTTLDNLIIEEPYLFKVNYVEIDNWTPYHCYIPAHSIEDALSIANSVLDLENEFVLSIKVVMKKKSLSTVYVRIKPTLDNQ